jgi:hypothetical protein
VEINSCAPEHIVIRFRTNLLLNKFPWLSGRENEKYCWRNAEPHNFSNTVLKALPYSTTAAYVQVKSSCAEIFQVHQSCLHENDRLIHQGHDQSSIDKQLHFKSSSASLSCCTNLIDFY